MLFFCIQAEWSAYGIGKLAGCIRFAYFFSFGVPLLTKTCNAIICHVHAHCLTAQSELILEEKVRVSMPS